MTQLHASAPAIVWFRDDQRLADNPALSAAAQSGRPLICIYIHDEGRDGLRPLGGAARWWLDGSLAALQQTLAKRGGRLAILHGPAAELIDFLVAETGAGAIYWNRRYDQASRARDDRIKADLTARGLQVESFNGHLLHEPWTVTSKAGTPFRVFTAYWRAALARGAPAAPLATPKQLAFSALPKNLAAKLIAPGELDLLPRKPDWAGGLRATWQCGEAAAQACLHEFLDTGLPRYAEGRDHPDAAATSRLSPYLRCGNISVRQIWHALAAALATGAASAHEANADKFRAELGWRDFCYHLLFHLPDLASVNVRNEFDRMAWRTDAPALRAWQRGATGYPLVDAGMRELWTTGVMHNRVRMVAASFLTKHLLIDWRIGEAWFWDTLVDADAASNPANWQWVAGTGADAAPYFRIFNPILQGEKFDPDGSYVKRWVPELAGLPAPFVHRPWTAPKTVLAEAGIRLGEIYPHPIVDHDEARRRALRLWKGLSQG